MQSSDWVAVYRYLMLALSGLTLFTLGVRVFTLWQKRKERTRRGICFSLVYLGLSSFCFARAINANLTITILCALFLLLALVAGESYEIMDLIEFQRAKDTIFTDDAASLVAAEQRTLQDLANANARAALVATENSIMASPHPHVTVPKENHG